MKEFFTLKLLDRFQWVFNRSDIDYKMMRKLLQVKFTMDGRRVPTIFQQNNRKKVETDSNQYVKSLWIYVLFGLFMIPFILMDNNYMFQMSFVYGILIFIISTSLISDFSSVLLDVRDRNILYPKPINKKTISAAKAIHVTTYLCLLTVAIVGIPLIVGLFRHGLLFFLLAIFSIIFIDIFVVVLTALIYIWILKFFDGEKLKDIINYVQIGLSLAIMIGYQLLARSFELMDYIIVLEPEWWQLFIIPMWYGALMEITLGNSVNNFYILLALLSVAIPIISIWLYVKLLPTFERNLQKLTYHGKVKYKKQPKYKEWFMNIICTSKEEKVFFRFASLMMKNERDFKLKVYPSLGFSFVIPFIFLFNVFKTDSGFEPLTSKAYLNIYFSLIIIPTVVLMLNYSGKFKGAWVFKVAPLEELKPIFSGTIKAFLVKLYLPIYLTLSVIFMFIFGVRILPDLLLVLVNACNFSIICFYILNKGLPFSESFDSSNEGSGTIIFLTMLIVGLFAGIHLISTLINFGQYIFIVISLITLIVLWKKAFNKSWKTLYS
ncbi:hypothetical protein [Sutcliffiella sp. NC1]|uniref:hypothetical protein n=1 Tax=Sutcliffiella sp. NC1 TaxID=3004096 RepID=UPI0022DD1690|nr:hypothetical protein [Sutcliffiella sp. NC1]WBL13697.1 hypothetical protein O1A01_17485 [Sutcliffiella sp. NC1]